MIPDIFVSENTELLRYFSSDAVFVSSYPGPTGPYFRYRGEGYGGVDENGVWDGTGKWIDALEVPAGGALTNSLFSFVGPGWNVYNQSEHVGEAIALLDYLFTPDVAISMQYGPEGLLWTNSGSGPVLLEEYIDAYKTTGTSALRPSNDTRAEETDSGGVTAPFPMAGLLWAVPSSLFGSPEFREYRYFTDSVAARYFPGPEIPLDPGLRFTADQDYHSDRAKLMIGLQTLVEGDIAQFIAGQKSFDEWDDFIENCRELGADRLLDLHNANSEVFSGEMF